jgi:hypothetical protein
LGPLHVLDIDVTFNFKRQLLKLIYRLTLATFEHARPQSMNADGVPQLAKLPTRAGIACATSSQLLRSLGGAPLSAAQRGRHDLPGLGVPRGHGGSSMLPPSQQPLQRPPCLALWVGQRRFEQSGLVRLIRSTVEPQLVHCGCISPRMQDGIVRSPSYRHTCYAL